MNNNRNWKDPKYIEWRTAVRKRDKHKCRICESTKKLNIHHIKPYSTYPILRYVISNGITLCAICHKRMWSNEVGFASYCYGLVNDTGGIQDILKKYENGA